MNNCALPQKEEVKYLGIHLDKLLAWVIPKEITTLQKNVPHNNYDIQSY